MAITPSRFKTAPRSSSTAVGIATQTYASRVQLLIQLITELRAMGGHIDFDLPRIVFTGSQSAGKSSLVEAISGITVPRSSGTCTRCPMECRLSYSPKPWRAQILIRVEQDLDGNPLTDILEIPFGDAMNDKDLLEIFIKRAQSAVLNPTVPQDHFLLHDNPPVTAPRALQFSKSVVCIDISGPEVTDLSFMDLPGLIANVADGEDRNNIDLVKALVQKHIGGNSLILLTLTMKDDLENQSAAFLAKEADQRGLRTLGVLTKPDTLQEGEHQAWIEVLERRKHILHHGYFVTKQPATSELSEGLDHAVARERERDFFNNTEPWKSVSPNIRNRMGVPNLTRELSRQLSVMIEQRLPQLRADSRAAILEVAKALQELPPPVPENPVSELLHIATQLSTEVALHIKGGDGHEGLMRSCRAFYNEFDRAILGTKPTFELRNKPTDSSDSSDDSYSGLGSTLGSLEDRSVALPIYLDEVSDYLKRSQTRQLPFNIPFAAKVGLIVRQFKDWNHFSEICFRQVCRATREVLVVAVHKHTERFSRGGLTDRVESIVDRLVQTAEEETLSRLEWLVELEDPPFTNNEHYFADYRETFLTEFKAKRAASRIQTARATSTNGVRRVSSAKATNSSSTEATEHDPASAALAELARIGFSGLSSDDLEKLRPTDQYEQELICMAEVCAYFRVAYKRIIDNVPRVIDRNFLKAIENRLSKELFSGLGVGEEDGCQRAASYLAEDPDIVSLREELTQKRARLLRVSEKLERFTA